MALTIHGTYASAAGIDDFLDMSLEELVDYRMMSMSRKEQRVADMAAAAYVISSEEIRRSGAQSIPEALRLVPGLNVAQISGDRWAVSSRGFNERLSNKLLIQVDGRSIYSPIFSGVLWETQDTVMEDIERIEVIRGPGAALWGTNAMNGVINIVTRSAAASQGSVLNVAATNGGGAFASLTHGGILAQGGHFKIFGKSSRTGASPERDTGVVGSDAARQNRLGIRVEPDLDRGELSFKAEAYQSKSSDVWGFPSLPAFSDKPFPKFTQPSYRRDASLSQASEGLVLQGRYSWRGSHELDNTLHVSMDQEKTSHTGLWGTGTGPGLPLGEAPRVQRAGGSKTEIDLDFQQRRKGQVHDIIWGLNLRHIIDDLYLPATPYVLTEGKSQRVNYSAFVHDEINVVPDRFKLIVGSKFEKDGLTGHNIQPNVRALYTPSANEAFWGAISNSARSLRRFESFAMVDVLARDAHDFIPFIPPNQLTAVTQISPLANARPVAEKAWSLEAGWRKQFSNFLSVDMAVFVTDYSQLRGARLAGNLADVMPPLGPLMECIGNPQNLPGTCYFTIKGYNSNQDKARSYGGEWSLEWHPKPWWTVQTSYSYLRVKGQRSGDDLGDLLVRVFENSAPRHQLSLVNNFSLRSDLNLNVRLRHNSDTRHLEQISGDLTRLPPYTGLDMRLAWKAGRQTEVSLLGRNLLKDRHSEFISSFPVSRAYDVQRSLTLQLVSRF
ncbi:TonB-dependent siderophore receptor [Limnohabitans sp. 2KL-17]|uniref:TonB-dependent receptor plug domain-containing protein n=1 Tax=Limnohabitans sp. 2KL-17 TaxID=1100704 RepID=UPI00130495FE|nr:TonB-dependent receptor [Limnohabitans sp. 2KL-17]